MLRAEVNLVNLERVGFNLRNFDMVFVWKVWSGLLHPLFGWELALSAALHTAGSESRCWAHRHDSLAVPRDYQGELWHCAFCCCNDELERGLHATGSG
jgi:hypothetical protein